MRLVYLLKVPSRTASVLLPAASPPGAPPPQPPPGLAAAELGLLLLPPSGLAATSPACRPERPRLVEVEGEEPADVGRLLLRLLLLLPPPLLLAVAAAADPLSPGFCAAVAAFSMEFAGRL